MVGSAIVRKLESQQFQNIITVSKDELDLRDQLAVRGFLERSKPDSIVLAAAKVGGIHANASYPADFIYDNLMIQSNVIHAAYMTGVRSLLFLGSSCIYPKLVTQPMSEAALLTGPLEPTNEPYAIAKIAGIKLCESYSRQYGADYRSVMPTNLYGPYDNFHPENSHVVPALLRKFFLAINEGADKVEVWGSGKVRREFLHVDDMADACFHIMRMAKTEYLKMLPDGCSHVNVGLGKDVTIHKLVDLIMEISNFEGTIEFNTEKPDGAPQKLLDISLLQKSGWSPKIPFEQGLRNTYEWLTENYLSVI